MANVDIQIGYKNSAWFTANATLVLKAGQTVHLLQTGTYKIGDGTTQLSVLSFLGAASSITKTSDLINDGDDGVSHFITLEDLPSNLTLYATNAASDISTYFKLVSSITDPSYNTTAVNIPTGAITTTAQFIASLATSANVIVGNPGIFNVTTIGNIQKLSGTGNAEFYFEVWKRVAAGTETLITVSSSTLPVLNSGYAEFSASALWNDGTFLATDRIVLKYYATRIPTGSDPSYQFQFGGLSPVRTLVPIPLNVTTSISQTVTSGVTDKAPSEDAVFKHVSANEYSSIQCQFSAINLADSTTYFFGQINSAPLTSTNLSRRFRAPFTGKIITVYFIGLSATVTSSQDCSLIIKNVNTNISTTLGNVRFDNVNFYYDFTGLTIAASDGDQLEFQLVTPLLTTNGVGSVCTINVIFKKD